jgi:hypothetical protein
MSYRFLLERWPFAAVMCAVVGAAPALAQDSFADAFWQFRVASGFDYSSGFYGATKPTSKGPWSFKIATGWLSVTGPALLVDAGSADATAGIRTGGTAVGVADVNLYGTYSFDSVFGQNLFVDVTARLKAPAASFKEGLGTGEWDGALQLDAFSVFGKFMPFATLGYKVMGSPNGFTFRNVVYGSIGAQYTWTDRITTGISYDVRQASLRTAKTPQEGNAYILLKLSEKWSMTIYGVAGFSMNSPSSGGGLSLTYRWP